MEITTSHCLKSELFDVEEWEGKGFELKMLCCRKVISSFAVVERWLQRMLWHRFAFARVMARGEESMPRICTDGFCGVGGVRREWRRRDIHPVPVHRSRIRSGDAGLLRVRERRSVARWWVSDSVSGLSCRL